MDALRYQRPASVDAALACMQLEPTRFVVLAGGTDLMIKVRAGTLGAATLVDIKGIPALAEVTLDGAGGLRIGATVTMAQLYEDPRVSELYPALATAARTVGSLQIQHRATVLGNVCNASPCMDTAPPLLLLGGVVEAACSSGTRSIPLTQFFRGVKQTALNPGEIATAITVPAAARPLRLAFGKIKRVLGHDLALVNAAVVYDPAEHSLRAAIGSCGTTPVVSDAVDGAELCPARVAQLGEQLAAAALKTICPIDDVRASAEYRRDMAALLCRRLLAELAREQGGR